MAKHTTHTYTCDRCSADVPESWLQRGEGVTVKATFFSLKKGRRDREWEHICERCTAAITAFFDPDPLTMNVTAEDRRDARVWWATVTAYVNKEMAEYIMVRARRMIGDWTP